MKKTVTEMKSVFNKLTVGLTWSKRIIKLEDESIEMIKSEEQKQTP